MMDKMYKRHVSINVMNNSDFYVHVHCFNVISPVI